MYMYINIWMHMYKHTFSYEPMKIHLFILLYICFFYLLNMHVPLWNVVILFLYYCKHDIFGAIKFNGIWGVLKTFTHVCVCVCICIYTYTYTHMCTFTSKYGCMDFSEYIFNTPFVIPKEANYQKLVCNP